MKQKVQVVCTQSQKQRIQTLLSEALFGPRNLTALAAEFPKGPSTPGFPDLKAEMDIFRTLPVNGRMKKLNSKLMTQSAA